MKVNHKKCIDCGAVKQSALEIGSWQCEGCQNDLFKKARSRLDGIVMPTLQDNVVDLTEQGKNAKEIADMLNLTTHTVYQMRYDAKKEGVAHAE